MKFFILVTDREIRGAFFFCLGIFFDMEQLSKYIQTSLTKKCFLCFVYFEFEHFAFLDEGIFVLFNITGSHHGNGNVGYTSSDSQFLNDVQLFLFRWSSYTKKKGFIIMFMPEKHLRKIFSTKTHLSIHSQTALVRVVTRLLEDC